MRQTHQIQSIPLPARKKRQKPKQTAYDSAFTQKRGQLQELVHLNAGARYLPQNKQNDPGFLMEKKKD